MVAVSFGSYASDAVADNADWVALFAVLDPAGDVRSEHPGLPRRRPGPDPLVVVVVGILIVFSVATLANMDVDLLAFSGYPSLREIVSSVALTFFAFLGFGVITFTANDLADPARQLPKAIYLALGIATTVYVAVALGVFGTLTVDEVIDLGRHRPRGRRRARARLGRLLVDDGHSPVRNRGRDQLGLYPAAGLADADVCHRPFPPLLGRRVGGRAPMGILVTAAAAIVLAIFFDLTAIASIGSAVALVVFTLVTFGHLRIRHETGARAGCWSWPT